MLVYLFSLIYRLPSEKSALSCGRSNCSKEIDVVFRGVEHGADPWKHIEKSGQGHPANPAGVLRWVCGTCSCPARLMGLEKENQVSSLCVVLSYADSSQSETKQAPWKKEDRLLRQPLL